MVPEWSKTLSGNTTALRTVLHTLEMTNIFPLYFFFFVMFPANLKCISMQNLIKIYGVVLEL